MVMDMFQCSSLNSSHRFLPQLCPQVCSLWLCLYCCPTDRFLSTTIFLDQLQLIVNIRDRFTFQLKTQSTKTRMLTILQGGKMMHFLCWLNGMTHSHKKECIWLSSNEVDELRAFTTEWSKLERKEQISYINACVWNLERWWYWGTYL